ncbi:MAG: GreA/GreB family elongation factor [Bdellovibrionaceae bacterium]|nr:GreA/GreB family elongation factor [Pseudobdellovibrionaceae bacterium]MBX3032389.1 GreA/GreB family elongation factor [Pseudobdellovibrionaceae bacterium]
MDKKKLVEAFILHLENDLLALKEAARATYEEATHEESKPENEYDTRGLEASYLAGAQAKRAGEIDEVLSLFRTTAWKDFPPGAAISATALVELQTAGRKHFVLLMPLGGGVNQSFEGRMVQVITPASALGEALLGLREGDDVDVEIGDRTVPYEILSVR